MSLLIIVTVVAVGLAAIALFGGLLTIVGHAVRLRVEHRRNQLFESLVRRILENLEKPDWDRDLVEVIRRNPALGAELFSEISELVRGESGERVLNLCRRAGIDRWLLRRARSWRTERRRVAVDTLRLFPGEETVAALQRALADPSNEVRLTAALSLAELGAIPPVSTVVQMVLGNTSEQSLLLNRLFDRLAALRPAEVLDVAKGPVSKAFLRPIAIRALGEAGRLELKDAIAGLIEDPEPEVRAAALDAAGDFGDFDAKEHVRRALKDPVQFVRIRAINAARRLDLRELAPEIAALLADANWWVRFRAGEALAAFGVPVPEPERKVIDLVQAGNAARARGAA